MGWFLLLAISLFFILPAMDYGLGPINRMRAGNFPLIVSSILAVLSFLMLVRVGLGRFVAPDNISWDYRPFFAVMVSMLIFGLTARLLGLLPAIWLTVGISAIGHKRQKPIPLIAVALIVSVACWVLFSVVLGVPLRAFASLG